MQWYAAHIVVAALIDGYKNGPVEVNENIYLIGAESSEAALERAQELGRNEEIDDGLQVNGAAARWTFLGVRKLITISNPANYRTQNDDPPVDGTELTYSRQRLRSLQQAQKFANGEAADLTAVT